MTTPRTFLVVEDESLIAMLLEDFLDTLGHAVAATAESVTDALERIAGGGFDGAIVDLHLRGGEPCWPVADALADRGVPFVFATGGHTETPPARHAAAPVLAKPFTIGGVEQAIAALG